jgi:hypothetical protein
VVNGLLSRLGVNPEMVNRSAPEFLPVTMLLNKQFIPAAITSRRALFLAGSKSSKPLKEKELLWPVTSH